MYLYSMGGFHLCAISLYAEKNVWRKDLQTTALSKIHPLWKKDMVSLTHKVYHVLFLLWIPYSPGNLSFLLQLRNGNAPIIFSGTVG